MPDLLEVIADNDAAVLTGWAAVFNDRAPRFGQLTEVERARELLTLAREFSRRAAWAADTADGWLTELKLRLRDGMSGERTLVLLRSGRALCGTCRSVLEIAGDLWRLAEGSGAPDEANAAKDALATAVERLAAVEAEIDRFVRIIDRPFPEFDEDKVAKGKQQIREGKWLTPEQAKAAFLKSE